LAVAARRCYVAPGMQSSKAAGTKKPLGFFV
jgi:hypothetical protein